MNHRLFDRLRGGIRAVGSFWRACAEGRIKRLRDAKAMAALTSPRPVMMSIAHWWRERQSALHALPSTDWTRRRAWRAEESDVLGATCLVSAYLFA